MTGFCTSPRFVLHATGAGHPEQPDRIRAVCLAAAQAGLIRMPEQFADFSFDFGPLPRVDKPLIELAPQAVDEAVLRLVHTPELIGRIRSLSESGGGRIDEDTVVSRESYGLACLAAGAVVTSTVAVLEGRLRRCFAAVRPPGHHAEPSRAMGFCLFNSVAVAARVAQQRFGLERVAIVDFDVHHGNGTQAAFVDDPTVLYVSLHQHPRTCYPGTGYDREKGLGMGEGYTLNVSLPPGSGDADYRHAIDERVIPALHDFGPELLFLSAGFDAHADDPLAEMNVSEQGFFYMTRQLVSAADQMCGGRVVSVLEGGYDLRALGRSVVQHLIALQSES